MRGRAAWPAAGFVPAVCRGGSQELPAILPPGEDLCPRTGRVVDEATGEPA